MTIEGTCDGGDAELGKRTYFPGIVIRSTCPPCGTPYERDMANRYLFYPVVGRPIELTGYCGSCDHEWPLGSVVVGMTLTLEGDIPVRSPSEQRAKSMVADMLDGLECPLREAVRADLSPDDCTHEDADHALDSLQRVLRGTPKA